MPMSPEADGFMPPWAEWDFNEWETCTDTEQLLVRKTKLQRLVKPVNLALPKAVVHLLSVLGRASSLWNARKATSFEL